VVRAGDFKGNLGDFLREYNYQSDLTKKLDDLADLTLTPELINKIVLWKVNRFVWLEESLLDRLDALKTLEAGAHRQADSVVELLLAVHGIDLPMASTLLRFRNPKVFQIIDRHAYRAVYGEDYPLYGQSPTARKLELYFAYLDQLRSLCERTGLRFEVADRALYVFDKKKNGALGS
jgi:thermostable 8-oxoguanine DNA glycosylase